MKSIEKSLLGCELKHFFQSRELIKDESGVLFLNLKHDLVTLVSSLRLYQDSSALFVDAGLVARCSCELNLPIDLGDTTGLIP